ncbi:phage virion morphogenesis protein [Salmonella enterica subsp. enterica]|nr:phage virion morphogenesis protein [Salmonella enterica subsp. enterica]
MDELQKVDDWLTALLANLEPAARSRMMRQLAQQLRRTQQQNIRLQRNPDGSGYEPRRVTARSKKGRIKRQMFAKLRTTKYLKTTASADSASVQFDGKVQRIARVHHYGLRDRVSRKGPEVRYAERRLLGVNEEVETVTRDTLLRWLAGDLCATAGTSARAAYLFPLMATFRYECTTDRNYAPYHQPDPHRHRDRSGPGKLAVPGESGRA